MAEAIVGRAAELSNVLELIEDEGGGMCALVIDGEAGIGKTTLWREGVERVPARLLPTLTAEPAQAESLLPFASLGDLLAPVLGKRLPALAPPLRTVLEIALQRRAAEEPAEQLAVSRATLELFDELGAARWSEMAAVEIARIPGRGRESSELTETEQRVAELVAEGLSNKEIAARLFVTVRTVEANLTKVYGKLGIRSRTELASRLRS